MRIRALSCVAVLFLGSVAFAPSPLAAQTETDCGTACSACSSGFEGHSFSTTGKYDMACYPGIPYCVACPEETRVSDAPREEEIIVGLIESTPTADLGEVLGSYRDRLLFAPTRNLVVVKGNGCNPEALSTVLFVRPRRGEALRALGLPSLEEYLNHS